MPPSLTYELHFITNALHKFNIILEQANNRTKCMNIVMSVSTRGHPHISLIFQNKQYTLICNEVTFMFLKQSQSKIFKL